MSFLLSCVKKNKGSVDIGLEEEYNHLKKIVKKGEKKSNYNFLEDKTINILEIPNLILKFLERKTEIPKFDEKFIETLIQAILKSNKINEIKNSVTSNLDKNRIEGVIKTVQWPEIAELLETLFDMKKKPSIQSKKQIKRTSIRFSIIESIPDPVEINIPELQGIDSLESILILLQNYYEAKDYNQVSKVFQYILKKCINNEFKFEQNISILTLNLILKCPNYSNATKSDLEYQMLNDLSDIRNINVKIFKDFNNKEVKLKAFQLYANSNAKEIKDILCELFDLKASKAIFVDEIKTKFIDKHDYVRAASLIHEFNLLNSFQIDEIVAPLIFLNEIVLLSKMSMKTQYKINIMVFLDQFLDKTIKLEEYCESFLSKYNLEVDFETFNKKLISQNMKKLAKQWKIGEEHMPHLQLFKKRGHVHFLIRNHYTDHKIEYEEFEETVLTTATDHDVQTYFIQKLKSFDEDKAKYFADHFGIPYELDSNEKRTITLETVPETFKAKGDSSENVENSQFDEASVNEFKLLQKFFNSKKQADFSNEFQNYLKDSEKSNPISTALELYRWCSNDQTNKNNEALKIVILQELTKYKKTDVEKFNNYMTSEVLLDAFHLIKMSSQITVLKQSFSLFDKFEKCAEMIDEIREMIKANQFNEVFQLILNLEAPTLKIFEFEEIIIPAVLLMDFTTLEKLTINGFYPEKTLKFLDDFLDQNTNINERCQKLKHAHNFTFDKTLSISNKTDISKFMKRLTKILKYSDQDLPNFNKFKKIEAINFHFTCFKKNKMDSETLISNVHEIAESDKEIISMIEGRIVKIEEIRPKSIKEIKKDYMTLDLEKVQVVDTKEEFHKMIEYISQEPVIGLDTESWYTELCLIQLASKDKAFIIDVLTLNSEMNGSEWKLLTDSFMLNDKILKLGFAIKGDLILISNLQIDGTNFDMGNVNFVDLQIEWIKREREPRFKFPYASESSSRSLANLVTICTGKELKKSNQLSNWKKRPLRPDQIEYAALDAFCLHQLYEVISDNSNDSY